MSDIELIPVTKSGEYIEVHPATLEAHNRLGWKPCARQAVETDEAEPVRRGRPPKAKE